ncbi:MAG: hypothetical protein ACLR15_07425 [Lachnospiraceae bacterium]
MQLRDLKENEAHIKSLDDMLIAGISAIDGIHTTVDAAKRLPGIVSLVVDKSDFIMRDLLKRLAKILLCRLDLLVVLENHLM